MPQILREFLSQGAPQDTEPIGYMYVHVFMHVCVYTGICVYVCIYVCV